MNVTLTPELERIVTEKVDAGEYDSPDAVVHAALALLLDREKAREAKLDALRAKVAEGVRAADAGEIVEYDRDAFLRRMAERHGSA